MLYDLKQKSKIKTYGKQLRKSGGPDRTILYY